MSYFQEFMREQLLLSLLSAGLGMAVAAYAAVTWLQWASCRAAATQLGAERELPRVQPQVE